MSAGPVDREDLAEAIALLAEGLQGALEGVQGAGGTFIPRPRPARAPASGAEPNLPLREAATSAPPPAPAPPESPPQAASVPPASPAAAPPARPASLEVLPTDAGPAATDAALVELLALELAPAVKLERLSSEILGPCRRCKLNRGRNNVVFGVGNPEAKLVFVGEGPGADEDRQGIPFVGKAGQLLTRMISAMGFTRDDVYICNVVKCRPPNNRDPEPDEVEACERFLKAQLAILQPKVIVTLGKYAAQTLLRTNRPISRLRGEWFQYEGIDLIPTFHPAYLLRSPEKKREAWDDLQKVMRAFGKAPPGRES